MSAPEILYQDDHLVAVHKPAGLLVHRSRIDAGETRNAMQLVRDRIGRWVYPVHRLDRPTSGVLLLALSPEMARILGERFERREVEKTYLAVVRGWSEPEGTIDHDLLEEPDPVSEPLASRDKAPRSAVTDYRRLATVELPWPVDRYPVARYSLLALRPRTGRCHQIRRHLKHIAHPVIGDTTYGKTPHNRLFRERLGCDRLLLHAASLAFPHPADGRPCRIEAPLDGAFAGVVEQLGWTEVLAGVISLPGSPGLESED